MEETPADFLFREMGFVDSNGDIAWFHDAVQVEATNMELLGDQWIPEAVIE